MEMKVEKEPSVMEESEVEEEKEMTRINNGRALTPQHVAASLRLMSIWHAYFLLESKNKINIQTLNRIADFASPHPQPGVNSEIQRIANLNHNRLSFFQFQTILVNHYSNNPIELKSEEIEGRVWVAYYETQVAELVSELDLSLTVIRSLWQVFNRMADEQYYPPALPFEDAQRVQLKAAKFFNSSTTQELKEQESFQFPQFLRIIQNETVGQKMADGKNASIELAQELYTVYVTEELRYGPLKKKASSSKVSVTWHKRYFSVVPFELKWWSNERREGQAKTIALDQNTKIIQDKNNLTIINKNKTLKLKGKDAKSVMKWNSAIGLVYRAHKTGLTPRQSQLLDRRHGENGNTSMNMTIQV